MGLSRLTGVSDRGKYFNLGTLLDRDGILSLSLGLLHYRWSEGESMITFRLNMINRGKKLGWIIAPSHP